jgi:putative oxidoreductase
MQLTNEQISAVIFLLRVVLGAVFFAHGAQKVLGWFGGYGLSGTTGYMKSMLHIPTPLAYVASFTEFLGSIAITFGFLTRLAAAGIFVTMVVAIIKVHLPAGFLNNEANKGTGIEYPLTLAVLALVLLITGGGAYSVDTLLHLGL